MKKVLLGISLFALALDLLPSSLRAGEKIALQLRLQKGQSYTLRETREQWISQTILGQTEEKTSTIRMEYKFDVAEVDPEGTASVKTTYHSCAINLTGPDGRAIEYDSANPTDVDNPILKSFAALIGEDFLMKITPRGHVREVTGMQTIITQVLENLDLTDGPQKGQIESFLKNQFSDQTLKEIIDNMLAIYPEQPVGIGDSWTRRSVISTMYPMIAENTWTLKDRREGLAVVEVNSLFKSNPEAPPMEMGPMKIRQEFSGGLKGRLELDESTGWMKSARMDQQLSGEMKMEGNPRQPGTMVIPTTIKASITIESY